MAREVFETSGFRELDAALLDLSRGIARRYGREALGEAGEPILEKYRARTTVKSGALQRREVMGTRLNRRQRKLTRRPGPSEIELHIGTSDPAGLQEEFGIRQAANPALTTAWDSEGGMKAVGRIGKSLGNNIEKRARRGRPRKS